MENVDDVVAKFFEVAKFPDVQYFTTEKDGKVLHHGAVVVGSTVVTHTSPNGTEGLLSAITTCLLRNELNSIAVERNKIPMQEDIKKKYFSEFI